MAEKHPYIVSQGILMTPVEKFRKKLPDELSIEILKKLSLASGNEAQTLSALQFLGVYDDKGKATKGGQDVFLLHKDDEFQAAFAKLVSAAYSDLFKLHGDHGWSLSESDLISYFRNSDKTPASTGKRQALAFSASAVIAGKREGRSAVATPKSTATKSESKKAPKVTVSKPDAKANENGGGGGNHSFSPTVHIDVQVHISPESTQEQIDQIFASMRKHLFDNK